MAASTEAKLVLELEEKTPDSGIDAGAANVTMSSKVTENDEWPAPVIAKKATKSAAEKTPERYPKRIRRDPITIERCNLLNMAKLIIKELIDSSLSHGRMLDDDHVPLQQFFVVLEHVLIHRLKPKKGILRDKKEFFAVLEQVEKYLPEAADITTSVRDMPSIKTPLGRGRAWLRLALMQKKLADYFRLLIDRKEETLADCYEPGAIMLEEEGMVISGLLVGLNVIDCNMCIKEEDLDQPMGVIDFSLYLRDQRNQFSDQLSPQSPDMESAEGHANAKMAAILDQKNYLEELNRHLNATVTNLQQKLETFQTTNALMKEDLAISKNTILTLQEDNTQLQVEKESLLDAHQRQIELTKEDIEIERGTYQSARTGLDSMFADAQKKLNDETQIRLDVEKELQLQISMKQEIEMALRLLEKDIHEKQDTVVSLRKQLEEIKEINLEMYNKLQASESSLQHKTQLVAKLEEKVNQMSAMMKDLEARLKQCNIEKTAAEETARKLGQNLAEKDIRRSAVETDLKIEREWRAALQSNLEQEKEIVAQLSAEINKLRNTSKDYEQLKGSHQFLQKTCDDQEKALAELGSHLSDSKLKMEDLMEAQQAIKEASWADDREVANCKQCQKPFSVARRKHHCRNCGDIYCNECSDNKMPLPSSSKPVRVCDNCNTQLLQRYSAK
ncbi:RUN and FYVE domain-containing protein 2-like isoform X2 [Lineus longissimus]|uniref:RUN and FYVE domain-containing protein 2-like isoform X2 n=1 Tax=Lineus longissimus TaxID=88925 RepID=UPI002B4C6D72